MTIVEFLEARIAEDEDLAKAAIQRNVWSAQSGEWVCAAEWREDDPTSKIVYAVAKDGSWAQAASLETSWLRHAGGMHIANWDPARVLAECAAKRAILAECRPGTLDDLDSGEDVQPAPMWVARTLAAVYKDHPDYRQEWA